MDWIKKFWDDFISIREAHERGDHEAVVRIATPLAEEDHGHAQCSLAVMLFKGKGVDKKDCIGGYKWAYIAALNGVTVGVELIDKFAKEMTPVQIKKARKDAYKWVNNLYPLDSCPNFNLLR